MPIFPGHVRHNNANAPIVKLEENQVKGSGIFADVSARNLLSEDLRVEGYVAYINNEDMSYVYTLASVSGSDWNTVSNWKPLNGESYTHTANDAGGSIGAASTWTITHNLRRYPSVTIIEASTNEILGGFTTSYTSDLELEVTFKAGGNNIAVAGIAYLN